MKLGTRPFDFTNLPEIKIPKIKLDLFGQIERG